MAGKETISYNSVKYVGAHFHERINNNVLVVYTSISYINSLQLTILFPPPQKRKEGAYHMQRVEIEKIEMFRSQWYNTRKTGDCCETYNHLYITHHMDSYYLQLGNISSRIIKNILQSSWWSLQHSMTQHMYLPR